MDVRKDNTLWISLKELWEQHPNLEVTLMPMTFLVRF